jgi:hypothetical protein
MHFVFGPEVPRCGHFGKFVHVRSCFSRSGLHSQLLAFLDKGIISRLSFSTEQNPRLVEPLILYTGVTVTPFFLLLQDPLLKQDIVGQRDSPVRRADRVQVCVGQFKVGNRLETQHHLQAHQQVARVGFAVR